MTQGIHSTCQQFQASFLAVIEEDVDGPESITEDDPELTFLKEVMNFREADIQHTINDALEFFNESYGLDFSVLPPNDENQYFYENAILSPFRLVDVDYLVTVNNWIRTGITRSNCYQIRDGGFRVTFSADQTLRGTYGGESGVVVGEDEHLFYGFYNIDACEQSPVIIQYQSGSPIRRVAVDGFHVTNNDLYSHTLGYGKAQGVFILTQDPEEPDEFHLSGRNVFTFLGKERKDMAQGAYKRWYGFGGFGGFHGFRGYAGRYSFHG